ncbi:MAG TPA: LytTR family DNA-binding domain-containing protein [Chitinophagaceae bacterium]|jgi:DNA-binding LytR/AlgR family response regulator|nr:LytTR family DNA-binding domain-containing protein [Chitinophagaceae bacterium]
MNILIVEDEVLLAKQLKASLLSIEPGMKVAGQTNSIATTVQWLQSHAAPDLIFMDIELADGQCFQIFQEVEIKTPVIFTTAYDEYALQAFKVNSVDYLLKPINTEELRTAIGKFREVHGKPTFSLEHLVQQLQQSGRSDAYKDRFLVKQGQKLISIDVRDIALFSARNTLNFLTTKGKQKFVIDFTLDEVESVVHPKQFFRINRQFILAHDMIAAVHPWFNGKLKVDIHLPLEEDLIISRDKTPVFKTWLGG